MPSELDTRELSIYASHMSLFLRDKEQVSDVDYGAWSDPEVDLRRVLASPYELQVATARYDVVPVVVRVLSEPPALAQTSLHVVECDLQIPSGVLLVHSVADDDDDIAKINVRPGRHRVRVSYLPRTVPAPGSDDEAPGDQLDYQFDLWPTVDEEAPLTRVQGEEIWAG
jgi:hypothetical protein